MISRKTKYGLNALIYLAKRYEQGPVLISDLARDERIPKKFLEAILLDLKKNGILESKKGKGGGYCLNLSPNDIKVGHVVRILNGTLAPVPCVSHISYHECEECLEESCCAIRLIMKDVRDAIANILDGTTLKDMIERADSQKLNKPVNFQI